MTHTVLIGAGAMGGYFAGLLAENGHDVTLVARGPMVDAITKSGVFIDDPDGGPRVVPVRAVSELAGLHPADLVLVCVKSWQVDEVASLLPPITVDRTLVIPVQNGVDAGDRLAAVIGVEHAVGGVGFVIAMRTAAGVFARIGGAPSLEIGGLSDRVDPARLAAAATALAAAGIRCRVSDDIRRALWRKLVFIASFGGVCALTGERAGVIRSLPRCRVLVESAMREVASVARAASVAVTDADIERTIAQVDGLDPDATASMARDLWAGRPSELFDQNGAVVRYGERFGVPTPVHEMIYGALLPRELRVRGIEREPAEP